MTYHVRQQGKARMATNVNLDALIPREDFEALSANDDAPVPMTVTITDLEPERLFYLALRQPGFQRESAEWDPKRVSHLVKTFIDGDLIPSVILWKHREHLFVIDGSHRLSALISWVQDDYGDGERSQRFFGHSIPLEQAEYAKKPELLPARKSEHTKITSRRRAPRNCMGRIKLLEVAPWEAAPSLFDGSGGIPPRLKTPSCGSISKPPTSRHKSSPLSRAVESRT